MREVLPLQREWTFHRFFPNGEAEPSITVDLPHSPALGDLNGREHWFGECEYRRTLVLPPDFPSARRALYLGAAMHTAVVSVDGVEQGRHFGGYLPCEIDLTAALRDPGPHDLVIRLDNRDNPDIPPGKPFAELDFCWHGGLYREAELRGFSEIYITDPVAANVPASGGVFIRTLNATESNASVGIKTQVANAGAQNRKVTVSVEIFLHDVLIVRGENKPLDVAKGHAAIGEIELTVPQPALWQPNAPHLYHAVVSVQSLDGAILDQRTERFGIRTFSFSRSGGFVLNGKRLRLRGVNRHQEYPYVGYAVPPPAQRRDARRIKEAGFDYVRLSHYPQSPAFLDACDELGIVVMNSIPGWQFLGGERFREIAFQNARDLIRRDRNHPCVVLWELSLNETEMDAAFMDQLHRIGHEEYPGDQMYTCGWIDRYDVYIHSRQHGEIHRWQNGDKALVVAEYGDWEFYAATEGFDQKTGSGRFADWSHGRHLRGEGERGLRQQAVNHVIALNDTLYSPAVLDGLWSMFDYTRGYDPHRAACGIMDVFRLPKFSYYFFRSQRHVSEKGENWSSGPIVHIASYWQPNSDLRILVFSNCEEVELQINGNSVGRRKPDRAWMTQFLPHAPFVFELPGFARGTLEATGYINNRAAATHRVSTSGPTETISLEIDDAQISPPEGEMDLLIAHASLMGPGHSLSITETSSVRFSIEGTAKIIGPSDVSAEAGISSVLIHVPGDCVFFRLTALRESGGRSMSASREWSRFTSTSSATPPLGQRAALGTISTAERARRAIRLAAP